MTKAIPLYGALVAAGFPSPADDFVENDLNLDEHIVKHPAATFFVRVQGSSMIQANIFSGDILVVDRSIPPVSGQIVIAALNGELTVKRIKRLNQQTWLVAENELFPSIEITSEESVVMWGVVTWVLHKV